MSSFIHTWVVETYIYYFFLSLFFYYYSVNLQQNSLKITAFAVLFHVIIICWWFFKAVQRLLFSYPKCYISQSVCHDWFPVTGGKDSANNVSNNWCVVGRKDTRGGREGGRRQITAVSSRGQTCCTYKSFLVFTICLQWTKSQVTILVTVIT